MTFFFSEKPAFYSLAIRICCLGLLFASVKSTTAQSCKTDIIIKINSTTGEAFRGQSLKLTDKKSGTTFSAMSNDEGQVEFSLPCNSLFSLSISNFSRTKEIRTPEENGSVLTEAFTYEPDDLESAKQLAMDDAEKKEVDIAVRGLPDSLRLNGSMMQEPLRPEMYASFTLSLYDISGKPLSDEVVVISGEVRKKNIKCKTDLKGNVKVWIPKGDHYTINFKYNNAFAGFDVEYTRGSSVITKSMEYLGTKEIERRNKIEAERIAREEKIEQEKEKALMEYCRKKGVSREEGIRLRYLEDLHKQHQNKDSVILAVLNRNRWENKLIICDVTGSMTDFVPQLALWYQLKMHSEPNLQFVFFNDGENKVDSIRKVGNAGGIYYSKAKEIPDLFKFMFNVCSRGSGGELAESNMEALIKGTQMAKPFKELVMIADNRSPVWDIELLSQFKTPVHIIVCGVTDWIDEDYLNIALKTGGSIHTIEQDITAIARMIEGQEITINKITYRVMGGSFVRIIKI
jgi:hypothetical protein